MLQARLNINDKLTQKHIYTSIMREDISPKENLLFSFN